MFVSSLLYFLLTLSVAQMLQAPAINGACLCCCIVGIKLADLATVYHGSHAYLPSNNPLRERWAVEHTRHLSGSARTRAKAEAKAAPAPDLRTDDSILAAGERVDSGAADAKSTGTHGSSVFSQYLSYWGTRKSAVNDPMHVICNASELLCAV